MGDTNAYGTVLCKKLGSQSAGTVEHKCDGRPNPTLHSSFLAARSSLLDSIDELPSHLWNIAYIALHAHIGVDKADESLGVVTLFDLVHTSYRLAIGGITPYAPNSIGGIEYHSTPPKYFDCLSNVLFLCHYFFVLVAVFFVAAFFFSTEASTFSNLV